VRGRPSQGALSRGVIEIDYRPWLVRCIGIVLVTLMLVVVAEQGVRKLDFAGNTPRITLPPLDPFFSPWNPIDARIPKPGGGPTPPLGPLSPSPMAAGSAAVLPEVGGEYERWLASLRLQGPEG
jgi:hypothetical protein